MARLSKLLSAFLDQTVQKKMETSTILCRLAFETTVNVRYLIANFSPELINSLVRHSLKHERRLYDTIQTSIQERGRDVRHIEQHMLNSIDRAARISSGRHSGEAHADNGRLGGLLRQPRASQGGQRGDDEGPRSAGSERIAAK